MKITDVKAVYPNYKHVVPSWRTNFWQIVVRVETDTGVVGYGYGGGGISGVDIINLHLKELLVGRQVNSTDDIRTIWDDLYFASLPYGRKGLALMALSGIDLALWDLLGKAEGKPVYDLIGGLTKSNIRAYATGEDSERFHELGYTAHKFGHRWTGKDSDYDTAIAKAAEVRQMFGPDAMIMMDVYLSWDADVTLEMHKRLANYNIYWFEDVLTPDHLVEQAEMRPKIKPVLVAGGEHEFSHHGFDFGTQT